MKKRAIATVVTRSYLPYARALARSVRKFHGDISVYVLVVDGLDGVEAGAEPFTCIDMAALLPGSSPQRFYYTAFELCCAVRGVLHGYLLRQTDMDEWLFLDSDILVMHSLDSMFEALEASPILLVPHALTQCPAESVRPFETDLLRFGVYNGGVLGMRRYEGAAAFVDWLSDRLAGNCFFEEFGMYVDQLWLNLIPLLFPESGVYRRPGANVAYWNLYERMLGRSDEEYLVNGDPLLFVHFSQWRIERPEDWSHDRSMANAQQRELMGELGRQYRDALKAEGYDAFRGIPYGLGRFSTGETITKVMRRCYYEELRKGSVPAGSPFDQAAHYKRAAFKKWLRRKVPEGIKEWVRRRGR